MPRFIVLEVDGADVVRHPDVMQALLAPTRCGLAKLVASAETLADLLELLDDEKGIREVKARHAKPVVSFGGMTPLPELTAEERAAMDNLPHDFVKRVLAGERPRFPRASMAKLFADGDPFDGDDWEAMQLLRAMLAPVPADDADVLAHLSVKAGPDEVPTTPLVDEQEQE